MIKAQTLSKKAFLDVSEETDAAFWQEADSNFFSNFSKDLEDLFYTKEDQASLQWQNCVLSLYGHLLVYKNVKSSNKSLKYLDLNAIIYRMQVIQVVKKRGERKDLTGFSISRDGNCIEFLCKKESDFIKWRKELSKYCTMTNFEDEYRIICPLGHGGYGKVFLVEELETLDKWAAKFIKLNPQKNREKQQILVKNEIKTLRCVDHPRIIKLHQVYEMEDEVCLILEYATGDTLFDEIVKTKGLSERTTAVIAKQIFSLLNYLEYKDIIHRDIKPENIILQKKDKDQIDIKLIDFGLALFHSKRDTVKKGGTAGYLAPEILNSQPYDFRADLYSAGVILYTCLTGKPLFYAANYNELLEKNKKGIVKFNGKTWSAISPKCKDLLQNMLKPDPSNRISMSMALEHPWLVSELTPEEHKELLESALKFGKLEIPKEDCIAKVPESLGNISPSSKSITHIDSHSASSTAWITNRCGAESMNQILNSFYRIQTKDSHVLSQNDVEDHKPQMLFLPNQKNIHQRKFHVGQSLVISPQEVGEYRFGIGYNIQIHQINSTPDLDPVPDDEEANPCSEKYAELRNQELFFGYVNFKRVQSNYRVG